MSPRHVKLTPFEESILTGIVALSQELTLPLETYTAAIGRIRSQKFGVAGRSRGRRSPFPEQHKVKVTE